MDYQKNQDLLFNLIKDKGVLKQDVFSNIILNFKVYFKTFHIYIRNSSINLNIDMIFSLESKFALVFFHK